MRTQGSTSKLRYHIVLRWNGEQVLQGSCTAVMGWEILRAFLDDNFANAEKAGLTLPTLVDLANAPGGASFRGEGGDDTGRAAYSLFAISDPE